MPSAFSERMSSQNSPPRLGVEARGRLVEEEQLGPADDAERDVDPAALPARELRDAGLRLRLEADGGDDLVDVARGRVEARRSARAARAR